jgi:enoyl-CoA hydratase
MQLKNPLTGTQDFEFLKVERDADVAIVSMVRPPVNAVNQEMYVELRELFSSLDELLPGVSVVILRGEGKHFSAGNDLKEFLTLSSENSPGRMKLVREAFSSLYDCPVPTIAAVQGFAVGTGVALAGSCDLVVCGASAHFGVPEVGVGVMGGAKHLSRLAPQQTLRLMYYTADPIPASDLVAFGGISHIVPDEELLSTAMTLASRIARHSRIVLRSAKESLNAIEYMPLKAGYELEQSYTNRLAGQPDSLEARRAIEEKRSPNFARLRAT